MMDKIYVVTSGSYSDYQIDAVFSTKELAKKFLDLFGNSFEIEEYKLDNFKSEMSSGKSHYCVKVLKNGTIEQITKGKSYYGYNCWGHIWDYREEKDIRLVVYCWARDKKHAIKIAADSWRYVAANNLWRAGVIGELKIKEK